MSAALVWLFTAALALGVPVNWKVAGKPTISFSTTGVSGIFKTFSGTLLFDEANPTTSRFDVSIEVASINTGNGLQNKHAKSAEWFDAAAHPLIRFVSKKVVKAGAGYQAVGDLHLHGIAKEVVLPFQFKSSGSSGVFSGSFTINRNDFKIGKPGGMVGESIKVNVNIPVKK